MMMIIIHSSLKPVDTPSFHSRMVHISTIHGSPLTTFLVESMSVLIFLIIRPKFKNPENSKKIQFIHNFLIMFSQSVFYDTADLPVNVLNLIDQQFYSFVQERLGECQSELLKIQQINSVPCFLLTDDPCQVLNLNIDDNEVKLLKKQICFL
jgi:hypothetical protein